MIYGHSPRAFMERAFIENGPAELLAKLNAVRSTARSWRALNEARRLELVDRALEAANDGAGDLPLAL